MYLWAFFVTDIWGDNIELELGTSVLTDVVVGAVAVHVIPEVVAENGEEGVVVFPQSQAVLVVAKVIGLPIVPVKPVADN